MERVIARVRGRVQGVSFRAFVASHAMALSISGYARNERDGSVSVVAEGDRGRLEELVKHLKKGPPFSRVDSVDAAWSEGKGTFRGFDTL